MVHAMNRLFKKNFEETDFEGLPERALCETGEKTAVIFHFRYLRTKLEAIFSIRLELDDKGEPIFDVKLNADWAEKNLKRVRRGRMENGKGNKFDLN